MILYLKLLRPFNLLMVLLAQGLVKYGLFEPFGISLALTPGSFAIMVIATLCIAAGGNVINDIYDQEIDWINRPKKVLVGKRISEKAAYNLYILLTVLGLGLGFVVANLVGKPALALVFIFSAALLYWYATFLKSMLFIGNMVISSLVGFSILMGILFDLYPAMEFQDKTLYLRLSKVVLYYALAAFYFNLMREITKDIQDVNGDKNGGRNTLPIVLGISRTKAIVIIMGLLGLFGVLFFAYFELYRVLFLLMYMVFALGGTLLVFTLQAWNAKKTKHFARLSNLLKLIMLLGLASLGFIKTLL